jgi:hypothetical protein
MSVMVFPIQTPTKDIHVVVWQWELWTVMDPSLWDRYFRGLGWECLVSWQIEWVWWNKILLKWGRWSVVAAIVGNYSVVGVKDDA